MKVLTNGNTLTFGELDTALAEASYLVNCRPLQPSPEMGEDGFISPNDIMMGRSDKLPPLTETFDDSLTRRVAHIRRIVNEFWTRWSNSYYQSLVKYHKWRLKTRNAEPGDVVLVLDRQGLGIKGKFTLGVISSVQTDPDNVVRKVTVRYKLPQNSDNPSSYSPNPYKYAERNVRGLALVVTAQERNKVENIDLDTNRFDKNVSTEDSTDKEDSANEKNKEDSDNEKDKDESSLKNEDSESNDEQFSQVNPLEEDSSFVNEDVRSLEKENLQVDKDTRNSRVLAPSSVGRKRWKPNKLDL